MARCLGCKMLPFICIIGLSIHNLLVQGKAILSDLPHRYSVVTRPSTDMTTQENEEMMEMPKCEMIGSRYAIATTADYREMASSNASSTVYPNEKINDFAFPLVKEALNEEELELKKLLTKLQPELTKNDTRVIRNKRSLHEELVKFRDSLVDANLCSLTENIDVNAVLANLNCSLKLIHYSTYQLERHFLKSRQLSESLNRELYVIGTDAKKINNIIKGHHSRVLINPVEKMKGENSVIKALKVVYLIYQKLVDSLCRLHSFWQHELAISTINRNEMILKHVGNIIENQTLSTQDIFCELRLLTHWAENYRKDNRKEEISITDNPTVFNEESGKTESDLPKREVPVKSGDQTDGGLWDIKLSKVLDNFQGLNLVRNITITSCQPERLGLEYQASYLFKYYIVREFRMLLKTVEKLIRESRITSALDYIEFVTTAKPAPIYVEATNSANMEEIDKKRKEKAKEPQEQFQGDESDDDFYYK